jgi:hypothetical protein
MEEEDAEPPIETSIGELEQWRLLAAVCPIFSYDHRWTALDSGKLHVKVIAKQADLFKANILEVPVHVPTEHVLVSNAYRDFELEINALLSSLECLVDGAKIPLCAAGEFELSFSLGIRRRCPNLLALHKLMVSNGETVTFEEYGQYLYLSQDVKTFKQIRFQVERFHTSTSKMLGDSVAAVLTTHTPAQAEQSPSAGPKIYFNRALWSSSKRLFESLVTNLKSCDRVRAEQTALNPDHKAMLHLSLTQDLQRSHEIGPEVCMALAACADQKSWHQTYCTISSAKFVSLLIQYHVCRKTLQRSANIIQPTTPDACRFSGECVPCRRRGVRAAESIQDRAPRKQLHRCLGHILWN